MTWRHARLNELHAAAPDLDQLTTTPAWDQVLTSCTTCGQVLMLVSTP